MGFESMVSERHMSYMCQESAMHGARTLGFSRLGHPKPLLGISFGLSFSARMRENVDILANIWAKIFEDIWYSPYSSYCPPQISNLHPAPKHLFTSVMEKPAQSTPSRHYPNLPQHLIHCELLKSRGR